MAHHVYQTKALILRGVDTGDANRYIDVFTRDMGLVRAVAKSARRERSKLRYSLQDYTVGNVSLVRGRDVWRITGAKETFNTYHTLKHDRKKLVLFKRISSLLSRLLHGEEKNTFLFDTVMSFIVFLQNEDMDEKHLKGSEYVTVLRVLHGLGYTLRDDAFLTTTDLTPDYFETVLREEKDIIKQINSALKDSQL